MIKQKTQEVIFIGNQKNVIDFQKDKIPPFSELEAVAEEDLSYGDLEY